MSSGRRDKLGIDLHNRIARRRQPDSGFTLLEVMVAIVLTSLVVLVAYAAAQVSFDARARLTAHLRAVQSTRSVRELIQGALRDARAPQRPGDAGFTLEGNRLSFVAAGGVEPLDPDYDWLIAIQPSTQGLVFSGVPLGHAPAAAVEFRVPDVTRWDVRVLAPAGSQWVSNWPITTLMPRAVWITFWHDSVTVGLPIRVMFWSDQRGQDSLQRVPQDSHRQLQQDSLPQ
jgi:prepilin-type N-terminal cleavage/methylation domain-containing protein